MIIRLGSDVEELREEVVKLNQTVASLRHELAIALGGSLPASPLRTAGLSNALECLLHFLADSPVHPEMQLPIVDAISFIWHCKKAGLAGNVLPSKPLKPHHTRADMAHFYGGELMHDDGPIAGDFVMPSLRQCKEWGHTTGVYPRRDLRATFASNVAHYHAMKGVFTGFAMGRTTPAMNRALEFHSDGSTFNSVSHFPVVLKYEMPTDGSDPFAGIDEGEGDISGIIQFWQSIINELQAAGGWFMGMLTNIEGPLAQDDPRLRIGAMREFMALKYVPAMVVTCNEKGHILYQNAAALGALGVHGSDQLVLDLGDSAPRLACYSESEPVNYLQELLGCQAENVLQRVKQRGLFRRRLRIRSHQLLLWMGLKPTAQVYHDVSISKLKDGVTLKTVFIVAQVDVTDVVRAEHKVQRMQRQQHSLLREILPQQVIDMLLGDHTSPAQELPTPAQKALPMRSSSGVSGFSTMSQIGWDNCPSTAPSAPGASPPPKELEQFSLSTQPIQPAAGQPLPVPTVATKASPAPNGSRSPGLLMPDALLSSWAAIPGLDAPAQPLPLSSLLRSTQSMVQRPAESGLPAELVARRRPPGQGSPLQVGARHLRSAHTLGPLQLDCEVEALCQALGYLLDPDEQAHKPGNRHKARQQQAVQPQLSMPPTQPRPPAVPGTEGAKLRHAKLSNVLETEAEAGLDVELDRSSCQQQGGFGSSSSSLLVSPQLSRADVMRLSTWHESVSILFTDIRGFTDMSQQLHPSSVMLFLNHLYSIFDALLETHDVYKIETIGDSYMVVGGLFDRSTPEPSGPAEGMQKQRSSFELGSVLQPFNVECEEHAERSTLAACCQARPNVLGGYDPDHASKVLSFTKAIVAAASQVLTPLGQRVEMRVGIHTGSIMTGVVGRKMPRFCCFGDTVNTASRMESTGVPGCIHVSEAFRDMLPNEGWQPTGGVQVKGKGLMQTYLLNCEAQINASTPLDL